MAYNGSYFIHDDFSGGYCGNLPASDLALNQAADLDNIVIGPQGKSFRTTWPTVRLNATEFGTAATSGVIGVGSFNPAGTAYILVLKDGKAYSATLSATGVRDSLTFTDRTGAVTIYNDSTFPLIERISSKYSFTTFNSKLLGFGGLGTSPSAPFKWVGGANNIAALGGSPPSARFCFSANNRVFAGSTAADPQTIYWSVLANEEDWTGTGSGSAVVGSLDDEEPIVGAAVMANKVALIFKPSSIHQMDLDKAPFPNHVLFNGIGAACPTAIVPVDGRVFFMDKNARMHSTDGSTIKDYPDSAQNLLSTVNQLPLDSSKYGVFGYRHTTEEYDWVVWSWINTDYETFTTIWDLKNNCWLRCTTGFSFLSGTNYGGSFIGGGMDDGYVFSPDAQGYGINDTNGTTSITSYWRTGWISPKTLDKVTQISRFGLNISTINRTRYTTGNLTGSWDVSYGFNFVPDTSEFEISAAADSTEEQTFRFSFPKGRGISTQFKITWEASDQNNMGARVNSILFAGKTGGQARIEVA